MTENLDGKRFRGEIFIALLLKGILIYGLWYAFFSKPVDQELTEESVSEHFLNRSDSQSQHFDAMGTQ